MLLVLVLLDILFLSSTICSERYIVTTTKPILNIQNNFPDTVNRYDDTVVIGDLYFHFIETEESPFLLYSLEEVLSIEKDEVITLNALYDIQNNPWWNLDRVDQRSSVLNNKYYSQKSAGKNVENYVLDTGVDIKHPEFEGRALWGGNFADNEGPDGCMDAHGTHVAGTIGSKTYGVAKRTTIISVKVLNCNGSGSTSSVIRGVEYAVNRNSDKRKVINMSLGGPKNLALNRAVSEASKLGVVVVAAAGNENSDACNTSPASETNIITVGAITNILSSDKITYFSNWGNCVDIFAPGARIKSTVPGNSTDIFDGTSQATPLVAGIVSLILSSSPRTKPLTPLEVKEFLEKTSTKDVIEGNLRGSPNRIVFSLSYPV